MRITSLWVKRGIMNRLSYWLYAKFCNEPYAPNGKITATVKIGNPKCLAHDGRDNKVIVHFKPDKFVPGIHDFYIQDINIIDMNK